MSSQTVDIVTNSRKKVENHKRVGWFRMKDSLQWDFSQARLKLFPIWFHFAILFCTLKHQGTEKEKNIVASNRDIKMPNCCAKEASVKFADWFLGQDCSQRSTKDNKIASLTCWCD